MTKKIRIDKKTPGTDSVRVSIDGTPQTILINKGINFLEEKEVKAFAAHPLFKDICKAKKIAVYLTEERVEQIGIVVMKKKTPGAKDAGNANDDDSNAGNANDDDSNGDDSTNPDDDKDNNKKPLTEKQILQERAKKIGINYPANATKAELQEMIEAVESAPDFVEPEADEDGEGDE